MLAFAIIVHAQLQFTIMLFMIAMGLWGLVNYARKLPVTDSYRGALVIGVVLVLIEALFGVYLYIYGLRPYRSSMHILYGITAVIAIPGAFAYTKGRDNRWEGLVYACVCLFLAGLSIRLQQIANLPPQ